MHTKISQMRYVRKAMGMFRCNDSGVGSKQGNSSIFLDFSYFDII
jgi:hypothetical protein